MKSPLPLSTFRLLSPNFYFVSGDEAYLEGGTVHLGGIVTVPHMSSVCPLGTMTSLLVFYVKSIGGKSWW